MVELVEQLLHQNLLVMHIMYFIFHQTLDYAKNEWVALSWQLNWQIDKTHYKG